MLFISIIKYIRCHGKVKKENNNSSNNNKKIYKNKKIRIRTATTNAIRITENIEEKADEKQEHSHTSEITRETSDVTIQDCSRKHGLDKVSLFSPSAPPQ